MSRSTENRIVNNKQAIVTPTVRLVTSHSRGAIDVYANDEQLLRSFVQISVKLYVSSGMCRTLRQYFHE